MLGGNFARFASEKLRRSHVKGCRLRKRSIRRTPTILQMEWVECGAASFGDDFSPITGCGFLLSSCAWPAAYRATAPRRAIC